MSEKIIPGLSPPKDPDDKICDICVKMKPEAEKKIGENFETFTPLLYRDQVVEGMNYFIKVLVKDEVCAHLRVYERPFGGYLLELSGVQYPKTVLGPH